MAALFETTPLCAQIDGLVHGFTYRTGGVSEGPYASLNLGWANGDDDNAVRENYERLADVLHVPARAFVGVHQEHGNRVHKVTQTQEDVGLLAQTADGLITQMPGVVLTVRVADCFPILFVDPVKRAVGVAHAGWRGTLSGVGPAVLQAMQEHFGCRVSDMRVAIGPGISQRHFEVSSGVIALFEQGFGLEPEDQQSTDTGGRLDLSRMNARALVRCGVLPDRVWRSESCTFASPDRLYSYRRDGKKSGRHIGFIGWAA